MCRPRLKVFLALLAAVQYLFLFSVELKARCVVMQNLWLYVRLSDVAGHPYSTFAPCSAGNLQRSVASGDPQPHSGPTRASESGQGAESRGDDEKRTQAKRDTLKLVHSSRPTYPDEARRLRVQGDVTLDVTVNEKGEVMNLEVLDGPPLLAKAAEEAVKQWKYEPPAKAPAHTIATISFTLSGNVAVAGAQAGTEGGEHLTLLSQGHAVIPSDPKCHDDGDVEVEATVGKNGEVLQAKALSGPECLRSDVVRWVRTFRYSAPATPPATTLFAFGIANPKTAASSEGNQASRSAEPSEAAVEIGEGVTPPVPIFNPAPPYSDDARKAGLEGIVRFTIVIDAAGDVIAVHALGERLGKGLDENASKTLSTWKFKPATRDGKAVAIKIIVEINFRLAKSKPA